MSHAALVTDGLFLLTVVPVLLVVVVFIYAVIQTPQSLSRRLPGPSSGQPPRPAPEPPTPAGTRPPTVSPAAAAGPRGDAGYVPRHAARSGPPWGPASKPPGLDW